MNYPQFWNGLAARSDWQEYILPKRTQEEFHQEGWLQAQLLKDYVTKSMTVLEHGVGVGRVLRHIPCRRRIGVDVSYGFLKMAELFDIEPVLSDGVFIPLKSHVANFTFSLMVFQHCDKHDHYNQLMELLRVTRPGGIVLVQFPRSDSGYYAEPVNTYHEAEVRDLALSTGRQQFEVYPGRLARYYQDSADQREWFLEMVC